MQIETLITGRTNRMSFNDITTSHTFIGVTNHGVAVWSNDPSDLRETLEAHRITPFSDDELWMRGVPESALHD
jgi:hypothetical protein